MSDVRLDASLRLVSDGQRRAILRRLRDEPTETTTVDDLIDHLHDGGATAPTAEGPDRDRLLIQLIHNHLPKLDDHGVIDYNRDGGEVRYRSDARIESVLDGLPTEEMRSVPDS